MITLEPKPPESAALKCKDRTMSSFVRFQTTEVRAEKHIDVEEYPPI
jgi:hypothetical protein